MRGLIGIFAVLLALPQTACVSGVSRRVEINTQINRTLTAADFALTLPAVANGDATEANPIAAPFVNRNPMLAIGVLGGLNELHLWSQRKLSTRSPKWERVMFWMGVAGNILGGWVVWHNYQVVTGP